MKVLLDECIPRKLKSTFAEHDWQGHSIPAECGGTEHRYLIVRAKSNRIQDLLPHVEACRGIIGSIQHGEVVRVGV